MREPQSPTLQSIFVAERIGDYINKTPLENSPSISKKFNSQIHLKLENWQETGSFKLRGALNKLFSLSQEEREGGIITASAGNHALGVAYAARLLKISAKVVVPKTASKAKIEALQNYDLQIQMKGRDYDEAKEIAHEIQKKECLTFIDAFSDEQVIAGQGTIGVEIMQQMPNVEVIVVPVGGGGLISGIALAVKSINPRVKVIGVQSEASPAMMKSLEAGRVVETSIHDSIADGLAGRFVSKLTLNLTQKYVDDVVLVSEGSIKTAMKMLAQEEHMIVEGSAAVGLAAFLDAKLNSHRKTVLVITGRNIDIRLFKSIL